MIKPNKHTNVKLSPINLGAQIISILKLNGILKFNELQNHLVSKYDNEALYNFIPALDILYCFGKVKYHSNIDSIEILDET